jgi:hypothetical protein
MATFPQAADAGFPGLLGWLAEHGITASGPPFIRYTVVDMDAELGIEIGAPVAARTAAGSAAGSSSTAPIRAANQTRPGMRWRSRT